MSELPAKKMTDKEFEDYMKNEQSNFKGKTDHLRILIEGGVHLWNDWRRNNNDIIPDLKGVRLKETDLSRIILNEADLIDARFINVNLSNSELNSANLTGSILIDSNFCYAKLNEAILHGVRSNNCRFNYSILKKATITESKIYNANLNSAELSKIYIGRTIFINAQLRSAQLINSVISNTNLNNALLFNANLNGADLRNSSFEGVSLTSSNLNNANLSGTNFRKANFTSSEIKGTNFTGANLINVQMVDIVCVNNIFHKVKWTESGKEEFPKYCIFSTSVASYLKNYYKDNGSFTMSDHFYVKQMISNIYVNPYFYLRRKEKIKVWIKHPIYALWWLTSRFGVSISRWILTSLLIALGFGLLYLFNVDFFKNASPLIKNSQWQPLGAPFYFSIVTFTTLGFGDVTPMTGLGLIFVTLEVILGYIMLGGLIAIFAKKFIRI